jgi:hypothetical protein
MPLRISYDNGQYVVSGVTPDPAVTALVGRRAYRRGAHVIGFDESFTEPIVVRAFYDPAAETNPRSQRLLAGASLQHVGYMQFMQIRFLGAPIPPKIYGGQLRARQPYAYGDGSRFVDFMGPADADSRNIPSPYYPYNGALLKNILQSSDLYTHPQPNGSLCSRARLGANQSLVASLIAEIAPGLVTPSLLRRMLTDDNLMLRLSPSSTDLRDQEPYEFALNTLRTSYPSTQAPFLAGLDDADVTARMIGDYVLLSLPDPENLGDTLVIATATGKAGGTDVLVYVLSDYDMESLTADGAQLALLRIRDYLLNEGINVPASEPIRTYGRDGLLTSPFAFWPGETPLELRYWTVAVALFGDNSERVPRAHHVLSGVTWSVWFQYDEDTGQMEMAKIDSPQTLAGFELHDGFEAYLTALTGENLPSIDTSNFTRASMRRRNFGAGDKPTLPAMNAADTT